MNRKLTEKKADLIVQQLKHSGVHFPVPLSKIMPMLPENPVHVIRELARKGYIANPELYEGPLPVGTAQRLEKLGVLDRQTFCEMLETGRLNLDTISYVGRKRRDTILKWARLNSDDAHKCSIRLKLPLSVVKNLRDISHSNEFASMNQVVRAVLEEVLVAAGMVPPSIKQRGGDPRRAVLAPSC
ncbi:MAG: hypothetical protein RIS79_3694 [Verrucomicrobiota bacterium]|jgi:hypothetical protein